MPSRFAAGTTVIYSRSLPGYSPVDGWALTLYLSGAAAVDYAGAPSGAKWTVTIPATAQLEAGNYQWVERVSKAAEVYDAASGVVQVLPDISKAPAGDLRSWEERTLEVIECALTGRLTNDMQSYQIAGRAVTKIPIGELLALRSSLSAAVRAQRGDGRLGQMRAAFTGTEAER